MDPLNLVKKSITCQRQRACSRDERVSSHKHVYSVTQWALIGYEFKKIPGSSDWYKWVQFIVEM